MNATSSLSSSPHSSRSHAASRAAIAAHFAGSASPKRESAMREHVLGCDECHRLYHRHLILAQLDPAAVPRHLRIARGLGLAVDARGSRPRIAWRLALVLVPAAAALLLFARITAPSDAGDATFVARGSGDARAPGLWIYRIAEDGRARVVEETIGATDELAFAYTNPAGKPFLMIFAVDRHRHVHWFHPAWAVGQPAPSAIAAQAGSTPHELPEAIRHQYEEGQLIVYALFAEHALAVDTVEARIHAAPAWDAPPAGADFTVIGRPVQVLP